MRPIILNKYIQQPAKLETITIRRLITTTSKSRLHFDKNLNKNQQKSENPELLKSEIKPNGTKSKELRYFTRDRVKMCKWLWLPPSFVVAGILYYAWSRRQKQTQRSILCDLEVRLYHMLPLRVTSSLWGKINSRDLPVWMRTSIYDFFCRTYNCNMSEALESDYRHYRNLSEFFIRRLKPDSRPISREPGVVSPADGQILHFGPVMGGRIEQVKGLNYRVQTFLGVPTWQSTTNSNLINTNNNSSNNNSQILTCPPAAFSSPSISSNVNNSVKNNDSIQKKTSNSSNDLTSQNSASSKAENDQCQNTTLKDDIITDSTNYDLEQLFLRDKNTSELYHCIIYLAPGDYHRFHSPTEWSVKFRRHFPGRLLSVRPSLMKRMPEVLNINERVCYVGEWKHGFFSMTAVGATNVGSIRVNFDDDLKTNRRQLWRPDRYACCDRFFDQSQPIQLTAGEDFGEFNFGSTIVLIFEAPKDINFQIEPNQKIKYGELIAKIDHDTNYSNNEDTDKKTATNGSTITTRSATMGQSYRKKLD